MKKKKKKAFLKHTFIPNLPEGFLFLKFLFFKVLFDPRIIENFFFFKNESVRSIENLMSMDQTVESFWLKFVLTHRLVTYSSLNVLREIQSIKWLQSVSWFCHFCTTDSQPAVSLIYVVNIF